MAQDIVQKYRSSGIPPFPAHPKPPQHHSFSSGFKTIFVSSLQKFRRIWVGFSFFFLFPPFFCYFLFRLKILSRVNCANVAVNTSGRRPEREREGGRDRKPERKRRRKGVGQQEEGGKSKSSTVKTGAHPPPSNQSNNNIPKPSSSPTVPTLRPRGLYPGKGCPAGPWGR